MKYLSFMMDVTKVLSTLSKTFQSAELCITDILTSLETTLTLLEPFRQEKGPQYKKFKEGYCEETSILQEEPLIYFRSLIQKKHPKSILVWQHMAKQVKSLHEHFSNNYLTEEEEKTIIAQWPALRTRLARQKAISPNDVFSNLLASGPDDIKDCLILLDLMLTLSPSTAKCEGGFSALTHLKCNLHTILCKNTLSESALQTRLCNERQQTEICCQ